MKKFNLFLILSFISFGISAQYIIYPPEMIGGNYNYKMIFDQEFYYPQEARDKSIEGEVKLSFIVGVDGFAKDFEVLQSLEPTLDQAYIDILSKCTWKPGTKDGQVEEMKVQLSEKFKIKKYEKLVKRRAYDEPPYSFTPYESSIKLANPKKIEQKAQAFYKNDKINIFKFIQEYIRIPDAAVRQGITGIVEIEFFVEPSGRLSNFKEIEGIGGGCTEEAYRLMQLLDWEPAKLGGKYVRSAYQIQVNFGNKQYQ